MLQQPAPAAGRRGSRRPAPAGLHQLGISGTTVASTHVHISSWLYDVARHLRLPHFVPDLLHRGPDLIDLVLEQVADQQVGHQPLQVRKPLDEPAEAEAVVVGADQPPHPLHALHEAGFPLAELRRRRVALGQPVA